jgi:peptide/nickel transport system substrate-binding protein
LLDGAAISNDVEVVMGSQIFETLMRDNPDTGELETLLAAEWPTVSPDGLTYTVKLRQGIYMTDGVELTANLVKWSWATSFAEPETLSLIGGYFLDPTEEDPASQIEVVDKYTVKFHLAFPFAPFVKVLASPAMCIYSDQHWDRTNDEYVGSGPWKFVHWIRDEEVLLERNDEYWMEEEIPMLGKMVWRFFRSPTSLALALREGSIDIAWRQLTTTDMALFMDDPIYRIVKAPGVRVAGLTINVAPEFAPLDDKRVRQAINWCIDRDEIIQTAYGGFGLSKIYSICPEDYPGYSPVMERYTPRDVDKAKQLLAEAGYADGFETDFWISSHQYGEPMKAAALLVKDQCADAGITINILDMEFAQWLTTRKAGVCPISTTHWSGDYFDSYAYFFNFLSSTGDSETPEYQYSNPEADALLRSGCRTG